MHETQKQRSSHLDQMHPQALKSRETIACMPVVNFIASHRIASYPVGYLPVAESISHIVAERG